MNGFPLSKNLKRSLRTDTVTQVLGILGKDITFPYSKPQKDLAMFGSYLTKSSLFSPPSTQWIPTEETKKHLRVPSPEARKECLDLTQTLKTRMTSLIRGPNFLNATRLGLPTLDNQPLIPATPVARKPVGYCKPTIKTLPRPNSSSRLLPIHQVEFLPCNEKESSKAKQSTSIKSSCHSTILSLMRRTGLFGDMEISFGVAEAKKRIWTTSEGSSVWKQASKAIVFAFSPH